MRSVVTMSVTLALLVCLSPALAKEKAGPADRLYFVQFHHPGLEHVPDLPGERSWNTQTHRRKFMQVDGSWLGAPRGEAKQGPVVFWGEWEPPSLVLQTFEQPVPNGPKYLFKPVREPYRETNPPLTNTDPFVFGGTILYGNCKQYSEAGEPTELLQMARGSVVLFGSNVAGQGFVLDTVFVVGDYLPYSTSNWQTALAQGVVPEYLQISPRSLDWETGLTPPRKERELRLYRGATPAHPVGSMFSYFPCKPWDGKGPGFARPHIRLEGFIDQVMEHGQHLYPQEALGDAEAVWTEFTQQVLEQGLSLCVAAELPKQR